MGMSRRPFRGRMLAVLTLGIGLLACVGCPAPADPRAEGEGNSGDVNTNVVGDQGSGRAANQGDSKEAANGAGKAGIGTGGSAAGRAGPPLRMLVVDDPVFATAFDREWRAISDEPLEIQNIASAELGTAARLPPGDGVVFAAGWLGTFAESGQIVPLPASFWDSERLARRELLETARKREAFWGQQPYAVPLGSNLPVLIYRKDLLESLRLSVPRDWKEFQTLADQLRSRPELPASPNASPNASSNDSPNASSNASANASTPQQDGASAAAWHGVLEPLAPGSAALTLLIRAAAYVRHPNQYSTLFDLVTMEPRIDGPPFVRALEELQAAYAMNPGPALERDVHAVRRELLAGHAAAAICWPQPATASAAADTAGSSPLGEIPTDAAAAVFGVAMLPGSRDVFNADQRKWESRPEDEGQLSVPVWAISGRLGGVLATSRRGGAAANLLALLSTADWGRKVLAAGSHAGVSRVRQLEKPDDWVDAALAGEPAREFATVVADSQRLPTWMAVTRIPGHDRYLATLDESVRKTVRGEATAAEALAEAAQAWRKITSDLDRDAQKKAYRKCLGVER